MSVVAQTLDGDGRTRLVLFYDRRSGRSRLVEGYLAHVLQRHHNHNTFRVLRVEITERADLAARFRVEETPTLLVIADKTIRARISRPRGCKAIEAALKPWLMTKRAPGLATQSGSPRSPSPRRGSVTTGG